MLGAWGAVGCFSSMGLDRVLGTDGLVLLCLVPCPVALQLVLQRLEEEVARIPGGRKDSGFTAPGAFLFELFAK